MLILIVGAGRSQPDLLVSLLTQPTLNRCRQDVCLRGHQISSPEQRFGASRAQRFGKVTLAGTCEYDRVALFLVALVLLVIAQIIAKKFYPFLYWATIIASTTFGTTMADFADRSLGIGYTGGSLLLLFCLLATLGLWYASLGSISVNTVSTPKVEMFYWAAITFSQTLGTALGDWMADSTGLGYEGGALIFGAALAVVAALYYRTSVSRVTLFWAAFILTRPLGATVGDFLDKPVQNGGLALSRPLASAVLAIFIVGCLLILPQRAGRHPGEPGMVRR